MKAPAFWDLPERTLAARVLAPVGAFYGAVAAWRMTRPGARVSARVICVGNFTAGGAGKTPTALALAALLLQAGHTPFFLTRGHGGRLKGPVRVGPQHGAADVGDEAPLLAARAPTIVARDRAAGAALAIAGGADVIVMDDGLQNPGLAKDLRLAVVDAAMGVGNGLCLPAGPLRATLEAQAPYVDAVLLVGRGEPGERIAEWARRQGKQVWRGLIQPENGADVAGRRVLAFAGIGQPAKFFRTLEEAGAEIVAAAAYADHAPLSARDAAELLARADREGLTLVTTEKDAARLSGRADLARFAASVAVLHVTLRFEDEAAVRASLPTRQPV